MEDNLTISITITLCRKSLKSLLPINHLLPCAPGLPIWSTSQLAAIWLLSSAVKVSYYQQVLRGTRDHLCQCLAKLFSLSHFNPVGTPWVANFGRGMTILELSLSFDASSGVPGPPLSNAMAVLSIVQPALHRLLLHIWLSKWFYSECLKTR